MVFVDQALINPYVASSGHAEKANRNFPLAVTTLVGQLALFQITFWGEILYFTLINTGLNGVGRAILSYSKEIAEHPEAGFVAFVGGPPILYVFARLMTLRRFFPESWARFTLTGAIAFQVLTSVGPMALKFADDHFGGAEWSQRAMRLVAISSAVFVTLLVELALAKLQSHFWRQKNFPVAETERTVA